MDDNESILERLKALQGLKQQGTPQEQLGFQQAMGRIQHRMNNDPSQISSPPPMTMPMSDDNRPPGVGTPTPQDRTAQIAAVAQMNAQIKAKEDAARASEQAQDAAEAASVKRMNEAQYAEGGMVERFPKLKKKFK